MDRSVPVFRLSAVLAAAAVVMSLLPGAALGAPALPDEAELASGTGAAALCGEAPTGAFTDVPRSNTHAANIDCVGHLRLAAGIGGGHYAPGRAVTRGQMASYLVNLLVAAGVEGLDGIAGGAGFSDIAGSTHAANIRIARGLRITSGLTATRYDPAGSVTRAQMASFVAATIAAAGGSLPSSAPSAFDDHGGSVHTANIDAIAAVGIVRGIGGGLYSPAAPITRAQMASYLIHTVAYLVEQGIWAEPSDGDGDGPGLVQVTRADADHLDRIVLHWDTEVTLPDGAQGVEVYDAVNSERVAAAAAVEGGSETPTDRIVVRLDGSLDPDEVYWLRVAADVVMDGDDRGNEAQQRLFTFSLSTDGDVDGGGDGDADGDGDGGGDGDGSDGGQTDGEDNGGDDSHGDAVGDPVTIVAAVTDPAAGLIRVEFSEAVSCTDTSAGRSAWTFANLSVIESGGTQAQGAPQSVTSSADPRSCELHYDVGIENGDFGTLGYERPVAAADQVKSPSGAALASVDDVTVKDGVAPSFVSLTATVGSPDALQMVFSEPVLCSTVVASSLSLLVNGSPVNGAVSDVYCPVAAPTASVRVWPGTFQSGDEVAVFISGSITSQSGLQEVSLGAVRTATAGA